MPVGARLCVWDIVTTSTGPIPRLRLKETTSSPAAATYPPVKVTAPPVADMDKSVVNMNAVSIASENVISMTPGVAAGISALSISGYSRAHDSTAAQSVSSTPSHPVAVIT